MQMNLIKSKERTSTKDVLMDNLVQLRVNSPPRLDYDRVNRELRAGCGQPHDDQVMAVYPHMRSSVPYARTRTLQQITMTQGEYAHANIAVVC